LLYFAAFASMAVQIEGLIGVDGILPLEAKLAAVEQAVPDRKYWLFPTLFWFDASDGALVAACYAGMLAASLVVLNFLTGIALSASFILYLSVVNAGQIFTAFQWDLLLLEAGFLALLLIRGSTIVIFLYRWLIARFMFMSGVVKIASGDPAWADLTALNYHYLTQPLPAPPAFYAYRLPEWFHQVCVGGVLIIELVVPFFCFLTRPFRLFAAWSFIALQAGIILTGNFAFFNLLTIALCLFLFEDRDLRRIFPQNLIRSVTEKAARPGRGATILAGAWAMLVLTICAAQLLIYHAGTKAAEPVMTLVRLTSRFALVNNYGPFAVMTRTRPEIIVQGSEDGKNWLEYGFKYKPDGYKSGLSRNIPHQPRLDWQMWFQALGSPFEDPWFLRFLGKLQQGSPEVLGLLALNPFPENPPAHVRALLYRYTYSTPEQYRNTGQIWRRKFLGVYWQRS
ncbi:MAG: lipase maturation factor family protein, partial [Gammaproteobacteria bacterium]